MATLAVQLEVAQPAPGGLRLRGRAPVPPGGVAAVVGGGVVVRTPVGRVLTYAKPVAFDADRAPVPVRVELDGETLDLVIDAADLRDRRFPGTIDPLVSAPQQISTENTDDVRVAHDSVSGNFLVVYRQLNSVFGQLLTAGGVPLGPAFDICQFGCDQPRVAFNESAGFHGRFLVVWRNTSSGQIEGRFVDGDQPEPFGFVAISQAVESSGRHPEIAATNGEFVVAWIGRDSSTSNVDRVRTRRVWPLTGLGTIYNVDLTGTGAALTDVAPGVAHDPFNDRTLVTYVNGSGVYGSLVSASGSISFGSRINSLAFGAATGSVGFDHVAKRYLVVWTEPIRAALLDDQGAKLSEFAVVNRFPVPDHPRVDVVAEGGGFTLSYSNLGAMDPPYNHPVDLAHRLVTSAGVVTDLGLLTTDGASGEDSSASMAVGEGGFGMLAFSKRADAPAGGVYVAQTARPAPRISTQPQSSLVAPGGTVQLSVGSTGGPYSFQWYAGRRGPKAAPIAGANANTYVTPPLTQDAWYWVRVTNASGISTDSRVAAITVTLPPTISQSPSSQTISQGQSATLFVSADSTAPLTYQWYRGASGVTSSPVAGATSSAFTTPPLTATTSYWVRASNAVGSADSTAATVTVTGVFPPIILTSPASQTIGVGQTAALAVTAASTVPQTYQWYQGVSGVISSPVAGATASTFTTPPLTTTTSYWVRVSNTFGSADSATAVITVLGATTPAPPSALTVESVVGDLVTLRWTPPAAGAAPTGYVLQGGLQAGVMLVAVPTGSATPIFTFAAPAGSFFIRMMAVAGAEESAPSNEVPLHVSVPVPPSAPEALTGLADGDALELTWKNTFGGGPPTSLALDVMGAATTSVPLPPSERFSFRGVPGGTYAFQLRALNGGGSGPASVPVILSFPGTCTAPGPPRRVLAYRVGSTVSMIWDPPATGAAPTGYLLGVVSSVFTGEVPLPDRSFSAPAPAGTYTLTVRSINACGQSAPSLPQIVTVP